MSRRPVIDRMLGGPAQVSAPSSMVLDAVSTTPAMAAAAIAAAAAAAGDAAAAIAAVDAKCDVIHSHEIAGVTGLADALAGKADAGHSHPGSGSLTGQAFVTVPAPGCLEHSETVSAAGVTPLMMVMVQISAGLDSDENCAEMADCMSLAAIAGTDQISVTAAFLSRMSGPIKINWSAA